jgi:hypothetical protein
VGRLGLAAPKNRPSIEREKSQGDWTNSVAARD